MSARTDRLVAAGYGAGWSLVKALPEGFTARAADRAADLAFRRRGPATVRLARNLRRVLGDDATPAALSAVTRAGLRSYARYWRETFRLPTMDHEAVVAGFLPRLAGIEHIRAAMEAGRGVVLPLPHSGNWDIAGLGMTHEYGTFTTVAERLKPESLYDRFVAYRESLGFEVLPLTGGANPTTVLRERLENGGMVCLVADRDLSARGVEVDFFGERTRMPAGPAMLAAVTGAALCPAHIWNTADGWAGDIGAPLALRGERLRDQVRDGTQQVADFFASRIAEHPADWHMMQPLWLSDLRPRPGDPNPPVDPA
ncbi:phosphatidylinositol mannoside acyltransferase [Nakamurella deserti]|uniref:phosphatidylinositol mannoside acyltransferase n=1 Tax=Nakamurella deserti TaxID=2164074 RepID=UPI000DBE3300|nr:phosphatidylinositol mannoside acyltransferase [Nakamurella deserti]